MPEPDTPPTDAQVDTVSPDGRPLPTALAEQSPSWDDGPWPVRGVALGEGDITQGVSGDRIYWPRETLEAATDALAGKKIVDDRGHDDLEETQPAVETIIGEITDTTYEPGVGVVYHGEVDNPDVAKQIERGRVDPSPMLFRRTGEYDEDRDAHPADEIVKWRDLAIVSDGASAGASIEPTAASALQAEALRSAFAEGGGEGTDGGGQEQGDSRSGESGRGAGADTGHTDTDMDLTDDEQALIRAARSTDDPVVMPTGAKTVAEQAQELGIGGYENPELVESEEYEQVQNSLQMFDDLLTDRLAEQEDTSASQAAAMSFAEKYEEFETDDGEIDAEALVQSPEAGGVGDGDGGDGGTGDGTDDGVTADALSADQRSEIKGLAARAETFDAVDEAHAESLREQAAEVADAEEFGDIEMEAL